MTASRQACALPSAASVATTASVVLSRADALVRGISAADGISVGQPKAPNSPCCSSGAAQNHGPSPSTTLPVGLTAASAPTMWPRLVTEDAEPIPPLRFTVVAPRPAPTLPSAKSLAAAAAAAYPSSRYGEYRLQSLSPPASRSKRTATRPNGPAAHPD